MNKRIINIAGNQGLLLKWFQEEDGFLDTVGSSQSHAYFKIQVNDFLSENSNIVPTYYIKDSNLAPTYFKTSFKPRPSAKILKSFKKL